MYLITMPSVGYAMIRLCLSSSGKITVILTCQHVHLLHLAQLASGFCVALGLGGLSGSLIEVGQHNLTKQIYYE